MIPYSRKSNAEFETEYHTVQSFIEKDKSENVDWETVDSFGDEWEKFKGFTPEEIDHLGGEYFDIVDDTILNENCTALDVGCGSGRWTKYVAKRCKFVEAIDPSHSLITASAFLRDFKNVRLTQASTDDLPFADESFDFVFSLGVLHHIPDTADAMKKSVAKLKKGGHFLVYLYYDFENRGFLFKFLWKASNVVRLLINKLPKTLKHFVCDLIAFLVYLPFVGIGALVKALAPKSDAYKKVPLSYYVGKSLNVIRNDSLDRFGTPLEQRFNKAQIKSMMESCGLTNITFSPNVPYWHAKGLKTK